MYQHINLIIQHYLEMKTPFYSCVIPMTLLWSLFCMRLFIYMCVNECHFSLWNKISLIYCNHNWYSYDYNQKSYYWNEGNRSDFNDCLQETLLITRIILVVIFEWFSLSWLLWHKKNECFYAFKYLHEKGNECKKK